MPGRVQSRVGILQSGEFDGKYLFLMSLGVVRLVQGWKRIRRIEAGLGLSKYGMSKYICDRFINAFSSLLLTSITTGYHQILKTKTKFKKFQIPLSVSSSPEA